VVVGYELAAGPPTRLELTLIANHRDFHGDTHGHPEWRFHQRLLESGIEVAAWDGATPWRLAWRGEAEYRPRGVWYWGYLYPEEDARGLAPSEDCYCLGTLSVDLRPGERFDLLASVEPLAAWPTADDLAADQARRRQQLLAQSELSDTPVAKELVAAADQFLVRRASTGGSTVIAGYHWFGDWGRDTMIALPGLTLATRRFDQTAEILRTFGRYVDRGMLPNRFPDGDESPEYNTVDATLWWFHALDAYTRASGDLDLAREQLPLLADVVDWHLRSTRYGIRVDPADGLLSAGEPGVQLTWMDARIGDWVVTPRWGKPVEVNALWLNALGVMADLCEQLGRPDPRYRELAERARRGMQAFWSPEHGYLFDVIRPDGQGDPGLRPNQLFALSLPRRAFSAQQEAAVLDVVRQHLLTRFGLRTLAPGDPSYAGRYEGDARQRDSIYHQGTVWPWLLGAYVDALLNVQGPRPEVLARARELLRPLLDHLVHDACLGSVSEIFDGDPPFGPRGCVAQAWSVAELLRVFALLEQSARDFRCEPHEAARPIP
jgi:predicted glycogen debranching enzyme